MEEWFQNRGLQRCFGVMQGENQKGLNLTTAELNLSTAVKASKIRFCKYIQ